MSISHCNLFTAPLLSLSTLIPYPWVNPSTLESTLPPIHCNTKAVIAPNRLLWLDKAKRETESGKQDEKMIKKIEATPCTLLQCLWHRVCALRLGPIKVDYGNCCGLPCSQNAARQLIFLTGNELLLLQFGLNRLSAEQKWSSLHTISRQRTAVLYFGSDLSALISHGGANSWKSKKKKKREGKHIEG